MPNENNTNDRFTAASHFFAEVNNITQSAAQRFGPVSEDVFRLTAKFTAAAGTKAYSICPGIVAIQPQTGSTTKVNLILRPYDQPIKGVNIRYFIYRGLNKSDFIDSSGNIIPTASGVSEFIQKINTDFYAFHADETEPPEFEAAFIGYKETLPDLEVPFDHLFFSITQTEEVNGEEVEVPDTAFELPKIDGGKTLGTFATGECGIDVILQYGDFLLDEPDRFAFDYNYVRAAEATVDLSAITNEVVRKRRKEQIFQFIDIAAFYGFHCIPGGKVTVAPATEYDASTIYASVLSPFDTKNTYYLYIQADRERSYDFYGTYRIDAEEPENMLYGIVETTLTARAYETDGWPLIIEETAQDHEEDRNKIFLQLVTDNNPNVVLYGQTACVDNALRNHFSTIEELKQPIDEEDPEAVQPLLTTTVILSNAAVEVGSVKKHIAGFGILIYQGVAYKYIAGTELNEEEEEVNVYATPNFFDDVFGNLMAVPLLKGDSDSTFSIINSDRLKLLKYCHLENQTEISSINTLIINDTITTGKEEQPFFSRVTYMAETIDVITDPISLDPSISTDSKSTTSKIESRNTFELYDPFYYELTLFTDVNSSTITAPQIKTHGNALPNKIILGISKSENEFIKDLCNSNELINPRLYLLNPPGEDSNQTSIENINYRKYILGIISDDGLEELILFLPEESIVIFSVDQHFFFSTVYSNHLVPADGGTFSVVLSNFY